MISYSEKCDKLHNLIHNSYLEFIMEAHNGLSARIAEEAGFKAIWASGLSMSASEGVRDNNELSFTEVAKRCQVISQAVDIPVLLDMDSGYGSFNTAVTALRHIIRAGVSGVVIEDKRFPKLRNSLHEHSEDDELADIDEHSLKIQALREESDKYDKNFTIVARLESFLAGKGLEDALRRAKSYVDHGADAILVHSKRSDADEVLSFMNRWRQESSYSSIPVIIVPTKYYKVPTQVFSENGISAVIWANHQMRACISAMQRVTSQIYRDKSLVSVEPEIATVSEVFRLQRNSELEEKEQLFSPKKYQDIKVIILAATRGNESLYPLTTNYPKCMIPIGRKKSTIEYQIDAFKRRGIRDIRIVTGYQQSAVRGAFESDIVTTFWNERWESSNEGYSISKAVRDYEKARYLIIYGDCIYEDYIYDKFFSVVDKCSAEDSIYCYTNRESQDRLRDGTYFGGIYLFNNSKKLNLFSYKCLRDIVDEDTSAIGVSIPRDSMADINDIEDIDKGIKLL